MDPKNCGDHSEKVKVEPLRTTTRLMKIANNRSEGNKIAKERKKMNAFGGTYKDEIVAMIETKKVLAAEHKEDKVARWDELKAFEDEKWKTKMAAKERNLKAEERRLALDEERIRDAKKAEERGIMFMNPNTMVKIARKYLGAGFQPRLAPPNHWRWWRAKKLANDSTALALTNRLA